MLRLSRILSILGLLCLGRGGLAQVRPNIHRLPQDHPEATSLLVQVPFFGFVYEPEANGVRAILGIPGASYLGDSISLPNEITQIHFAPRQSFAIAEQIAGPAGLIQFTTASAGAFVEILGALAHPDLVSFSPNGTSAVLYSSSDGKLQVVAGFPDSPQVQREIKSSDLPEEVRAVAIADDGTTLLEGTVLNDIYLLNDAGPAFVSSVDDLAGMAFAPGSDTALVLDRNGGKASLLLHVNGTMSHQLIADGLTDLEGNVVIQVSSHNAIIAGTLTNSLWKIDLQTIETEHLQLAASVTSLQPLLSEDSFLFSYKSGEPAWILDTKSGPYFVPAKVLEHD